MVARFWPVLLLGLGIALLVSVLQADTLSVGLGDVADISGPLRGQTRSRVLITVPIPAEVQEERIDLVKLTFPDVLIPDTSYAFTLEPYAVTTAWQAGNVTWTRPWRNPGGDFDSVRVGCFTTATTDSHPIVFDITEVVKEWQSGRANFGLLLKRPDYEGGGFLREGSLLRQRSGSARVKFYFTPIER